MEANYLEISLPNSKIGKEDKDLAYKYVCALLNSNGGVLSLKTRANRDAIIRPIEQKIKKIIGSKISEGLDCTSTAEEFILKVKGHEQLCTMNSNAYLPSDAQTLTIEPNEIGEIERMLCASTAVTNTDSIVSTCIRLIYGEHIGIQKSKTVQFTKTSSQKDFTTSLSKNVSAFANGCGGTLYCGVDNKSGKVEGKIFEDEAEKEKFRTSVDEYINQMIWPEYIGKPKLGPDGQLEISFEPVIDHDGTPMPSRFVVVINIPACPGGVFVAEPESYHIVNGEVKKMEFTEWKRRLRYSNRSIRLIYKQHIGIRESETVKFEQIQLGEDFTASLFNSELNRYVSEFANYSGGTLYCGVKDDGIVEGQTFKDEAEKEKFRSSVGEYIENMFWPDYIGKPKLGSDGQLEISFEPVIDRDGTPMPSRFVVVINVPACPGGVFFDKHENCEMVANLPLCKWNSVGTRHQCDLLDGRMLQLINNGMWDGFKTYAHTEMDKDPETKLVVLTKWAMYHYRKNNFDEAVWYLQQVIDQSSKVDNVMIFFVRGLLTLSALERSRGDHEKSYRIVEELLPNVQQLAPCILTAEFYVHFATMSTIVEGNDELKKKLGKHVRPGFYKEQAIAFYDIALQHLETINYVPQSKIDMQQKTYINMAILKLGCSLSGDVVNEKVSKEDIKRASTCLKRASRLDFGLAMTSFRSCHYYFAKAFNYYRRAQHESKLRIDLLEKATKQAHDTEMRLANKHDFKELSAYARKHAELFEEEKKKSSV